MATIAECFLGLGTSPEVDKWLAAKVSIETWAMFKFLLNEEKEGLTCINVADIFLCRAFVDAPIDHQIVRRESSGHVTRPRHGMMSTAIQFLL